MPITTTEYATFEKKAFFDNREWLNQENWQMYFGGSLPSGVIVKGKLESSGIDYTSALSRNVMNANYIQFRAGSILADGIFATYNGGNSIPVIKSGDVDRLFVARVAVTVGTIKIVGLTKVAAEYGYTPALFAKMLLQDESLAMTRNTETYDIPLCYEIFGGDVFDLRRLIYLPGQSPDVEINYNRSDVTNTNTIPGILYGRDFVQIYGGMNYNINFASGDASTSFYVYPNPSCSEKSAVVKLANDSSTAKQIRIPLKWKGLDFAYSWIESWDADPNNRYLYKDLVAGDRMTMIFTPNGHETAFNYAVTNKSSASGGGIDSEDYFTKQEIAAQMVLKANVSDMNDALALKEDKTALGSLAYQSQVDYVSQVSNKPTLGVLAAKDQANLTTDVNGILPIENGGTGASDLAGIITNIFSNKQLYVNSDSGNDSNSGDQEHPFKTIQRAVNNSSYGKTVINVTGIFTENVNIPSHKYIVISGTFTLAGYIYVSNSVLNLHSTGSISVSTDSYYGTIIADNNAKVYFSYPYISSSNNNSISLFNSCSGDNRTSCIYANKYSSVIYLHGNYGKSTNDSPDNPDYNIHSRGTLSISGKIGVCADNGSYVNLYDTSTPPHISFSTTNSNYFMRNGSTYVKAD